MEKKLPILFWIILLGATYHLVRDIMQIMGVQNLFAQIGHVDHEWCKSIYCDYVTFPVEIFIIVASIVIIKRNKFGSLGLLVLFALFAGLFMWFLK